MTPRSSHEAGFTLLEMLIGLVVLGLLIGGLGQALRLGILTWNRQTRAVEAYAELDAVDRALHGIIEQIDPGNSHDSPTVEGNAQSFEFTSDLPEGAEALSTRRAEMRLLVNTDHQLILRWAPYSHAIRIGPPPLPTDTVLISGVDHLEIGYLPQASTAWRTAWTGTDLPGLIRIRLVFLGDSGIRWPGIIATPLLSRP